MEREDKGLKCVIWKFRKVYPDKDQDVSVMYFPVPELNRALMSAWLNLIKIKLFLKKKPTGYYVGLNKLHIIYFHY